MARRKITDIDDLPEDIGDLNDEQEAFVKGILEGKTGADAYRAAYGSNIKPNSIYAAASRLLADPRVQLRISIARKAHLGTAVITHHMHIRRLEELRQIAVETGNIGAAVQAEQLIGKASGHYIERIEDVTKADPLEAVREMLKIDPDEAQKLANELGLLPTEAARSVRPAGSDAPMGQPSSAPQHQHAADNARTSSHQEP